MSESQDAGFALEAMTQLTKQAESLGDLRSIWRLGWNQAFKYTATHDELANYTAAFIGRLAGLDLPLNRIEPRTRNLLDAHDIVREEAAPYGIAKQLVNASVVRVLSGLDPEADGLAYAPKEELVGVSLGRFMDAVPMRKLVIEDANVESSGWGRQVVETVVDGGVVERRATLFTGCIDEATILALPQCQEQAKRNQRLYELGYIPSRITAQHIVAGSPEHTLLQYSFDTASGTMESLMRAAARPRPPR